MPTAAPRLERATLGGWGGGEGASMLIARPADLDELRASLTLAGGFTGPHDAGGSTGAISRGMGRSYGDAAQLRGGLALDTTRMKAFELDSHGGVVTVQAGVTLGELLAELIPAEWMLPVVPGTQHVSVGGAIASDVHGKNHATAGTLGNHVRGLGLLTAAGEVLELQPHEELFQATVGGMGLTGVIVWARIALRPLGGPLLAVDTDRVRDLDEALSALSAPGGPHRVAWLDLLCSHVGRGIVTRAEHVDGHDRLKGSGDRVGVKPRFEVPEGWPPGLLRPELVRTFNELRFRRAPRHERDRLQNIGAHMFPLDRLDAWPRLYGPSGFVQYQLAVPSAAESVLTQVIECLRRARVPCYLAVLKDLGDASAAPLSFPIRGWTLALDLPRAAEGLNAVLDECDRLVVEAGGRVYLTKDARLRPEAVRAMYPRLTEWQTARDGADPNRVWRSDLALRTGLVPS